MQKHELPRPPWPMEARVPLCAFTCASPPFTCLRTGERTHLGLQAQAPFRPASHTWGSASCTSCQVGRPPGVAEHMEKNLPMIGSLAGRTDQELKLLVFPPRPAALTPLGLWCSCQILNSFSQGFNGCWLTPFFLWPWPLSLWLAGLQPCLATDTASQLQAQVRSTTLLQGSICLVFSWFELPVPPASSPHQTHLWIYCVMLTDGGHAAIWAKSPLWDDWCISSHM